VSFEFLISLIFSKEQKRIYYVGMTQERADDFASTARKLGSELE